MEDVICIDCSPEENNENVPLGNILTQHQSSKIVCETVGTYSQKLKPLDNLKKIVIPVLLQSQLCPQACLELLDMVSLEETWQAISNSICDESLFSNELITAVYLRKPSMLNNHLLESINLTLSGTQFPEDFSQMLTDKAEPKWVYPELRWIVGIDTQFLEAFIHVCQYILHRTSYSLVCIKSLSSLAADAGLTDFTGDRLPGFLPSFNNLLQWINSEQGIREIMRFLENSNSELLQQALTWLCLQPDKFLKMKESLQKSSILFEFMSK